MEAEIRTALRLLAWSAAFWTAWWLGSRGPASRPRLAVGLVLGAVAAHVGFVALHAAAPGIGSLVLDPARGYSALFVPAGLIAAAPWWRGGRVLRDHLDASLVPLPLALAVARLGCVAAGCCHGTPTRLPWSVGAFDVHPVALYEIAGLLAVAAGVERTRSPARSGLALAGVGTVRILVEPFRAPASLGPPLLPGTWIASLWVIVGVSAASVLRRPWVPSSDAR